VGTDRKRAEREAALLEQQLAEGTYTDLRRVLWADFVEEHVHMIPGAKHATEVKRTLDEFGEMFNVEPRRITFAMIESYVEAIRAKGNTPATVNKKLRCLRLSFNKAVRRGYLARNPMNGWSWTAEDAPEIREVTEAEEQALLTKAEELYGRGDYAPGPLLWPPWPPEAAAASLWDWRGTRSSWTTEACCSPTQRASGIAWCTSGRTWRMSCDG